MRKLPRRDFTRGKDGQHSTFLQPDQSFPHCAPVDVDAASAGGPVSEERVALKWIHEYAVLRQLRHIAQQVIRHHLHVWPGACQQHREHGSIEHSKRMVGDNHDRTGGGNSRRISRIHAQIHAHLSQQFLQPKTFRRLLHPPVQLSHFVYRHKLIRQRRYASKSLNPRQHFRSRFLSR